MMCRSNEGCICNQYPQALLLHTNKKYTIVLYSLFLFIMGSFRVVLVLCLFVLLALVHQGVCDPGTCSNTCNQNHFCQPADQSTCDPQECVWCGEEELGGTGYICIPHYCGTSCAYLQEQFQKSASCGAEMLCEDYPEGTCASDEPTTDTGESATATHGSGGSGTTGSANSKYSHVSAVTLLLLLLIICLA